MGQDAAARRAPLARDTRLTAKHTTFGPSPTPCRPAHRGQSHTPRRVQGGATPCRAPARLPPTSCMYPDMCKLLLLPIGMGASRVAKNPAKNPTSYIHTTGCALHLYSDTHIACATADGLRSACCSSTFKDDPVCLRDRPAAPRSRRYASGPYAHASGGRRGTAVSARPRMP